MKSQRKPIRARNAKSASLHWLCITCASVNKLSDKVCSGNGCNEKKPKKPGE